EDGEYVIESSAGRLLLINSGSIAPKTTKDTMGVGIMTLKKGQKLVNARPYIEGEFSKPHRYRTKNLPALGSFLSSEDSQLESEQLTL
ncbi:MAG: topoisomerase IV, partial [Oscillospiraceae bacterium]